MPIEIRELVIKATVIQEDSDGNRSPNASSDNNSVTSNEEIIKACVERILEILKEKNER